MNQPHDQDFRGQRPSRDEPLRPVTANVCSIIGEKRPKNEVDSCNPGLWLDKFARPGKETVQRDEINWICRLNEVASQGDGKEILAEAQARRKSNLAILGADIWTFTARTTGPFTLHLARASALENAGLCLHPIYGFPYIPGTALKGMARGYAETVWFHGQYEAKGENDPTPLNQDEEQKAINAWRKIEQIFGWTLHSDVEKHWKPEAIPKPKENGASIGAVIFYDAWPLAWPTLICDIVNSHHADYYRASEKELKENPGKYAPGDWEDPVPAYFLTISRGCKFDFPLSFGRNTERDNQTEESMKLAAQWLLGAVEHRGAGAKTNTGYGRFQLIKPPIRYPDIQQDSDSVWEKATDKERGVFREETFTLELVSPAFLAGANQGDDDCDLRPSTLRGDLRWWWRTMHVGHLDAATLKKLEDAIWGSAEEGGAVSLEVVSRTKQQPQQFDKWLIAGKSRLERPQDRKTTQGLSYLAYGMDDRKTQAGLEGTSKRFFLEPYAQWEVRFVARSLWEPWQIPASIALEQATDALYLLCTRGGIGAKSRKGFGSIALPEKLSGWSLDSCRESAKSLWQSLKMADCPFAKDNTFTSSIDSMLPPREIPTPWNNPWYVLDQLGFSYQSFAQEKKHQLAKKALGLPRNIEMPQSGQFKQPKELIKYTRYSSPFFFHLDCNLENNTYTIRITAFPAPLLPDLENSQTMLNELLEHLDADMHDRVSRYSKQGKSSPNPSADRDSVPKGFSESSSPNGKLPRPGSQIEAILLPESEKTKRGKWKARHESSGMSGYIINSDAIPPDKKPGDTLTLIVQSVSANKREIVFFYPTDTSIKHA